MPGDTVFYGSYQSDVIKWYVVDVNRSADTALLVSCQAIDVVQYHHSTSRTSWGQSDIRSWLNGDFYYGVFTNFERGHIVSTRVEDSVDYVFILSANEVQRYLYYLGGNARLTGTSFCRTNRTHTGKPIYVNSEYGTSSWWLRSAYTDSKAEFVTGAGKINGGSNPPTATDNGVRPAMWVSMSSFR